MSGTIEIAKRAGLDVGIVEKVFDTIRTEVSDGEAVKIRGFGTFKRRKTPARKLATPIINGGKPVEVPAGFCLAFHQSTQVKDFLNGGAKEAPAAKKAAGKKAEEKPAKKAAEKPAKEEKAAKAAPKKAEEKPAKKAAPAKKSAPKDDDEDDEDRDEDEEENEDESDDADDSDDDSDDDDDEDEDESDDADD
jgi:nucleoid DNA-binding protein